MSDRETWGSANTSIHTKGVQWGRGQEFLKNTRVLLYQPWQTIVLKNIVMLKKVKTL